MKMKKPVIQVWNDIRVNKLFYFWVNYPFKCFFFKVSTSCLFLVFFLISSLFLIKPSFERIDSSLPSFERIDSSLVTIKMLIWLLLIVMQR